MRRRKWARAARVAQHVSHDRVVVMRLTGLQPDTVPLALQGIGRLVWDMLAHPRTAAELLGELRGVVPDFRVVEPDLVGFLDDLVGAGVAESWN